MLSPLDSALQSELERLTSELNSALERACEAEAEREAVLGSSLDCIIVMDEEGIVREWNPAAEHTFGWTREEAVGCLLGEPHRPGGTAAASPGRARPRCQDRREPDHGTAAQAPCAAEGRLDVHRRARDHEAGARRANILHRHAPGPHRDRPGRGAEGGGRDALPVADREHSARHLHEQRRGAVHLALHEPAGRVAARLHAGGMGGAARARTRRHPSRRSRAGRSARPRGARAGHSHALRVPVHRAGRSVVWVLDQTIPVRDEQGTIVCATRASSSTSPSRSSSRSSCGSHRRWRRSASSPAASPTTSTTCSRRSRAMRSCSHTPSTRATRAPTTSSRSGRPPPMQRR